MHPSTDPCQGCGKPGHYKMGICKTCRMAPCAMCSRPMLRKYMGQKICPICRHNRNKKESRSDEV